MTKQQVSSKDAVQLDRRAFLGSVGLAAGGIAVASMLPISTLKASEASPPPAVSADPAEEWHVDDMFGTYPRYSHPIPYAPPRHFPVSLAAADPIDHIFLV